MTAGEVVVSTAQVRLSADQLAVVAGEASSSRAAVADSVSTQGTGWKENASPGFGKFIDVLEAQAVRLRSDLAILGDLLRAAADVYDQQDHRVSGAIDSTVRCEGRRVLTGSGTRTAGSTRRSLLLAEAPVEGGERLLQ